MKHIPTICSPGFGSASQISGGIIYEKVLHGLLVRGLSVHVHIYIYIIQIDVYMYIYIYIRMFIYIYMVQFLKMFELFGILDPETHARATVEV